MTELKKDDLQKIMEKVNKQGYNYYFDDHTPNFKSKGINCSDEICPGSNERKSKIRRLMHKKILIGSENFGEQYGQIIKEMHDLLQEEMITLTGCSEREANLWIDANVDFNHVKQHEDNAGNKYLSINPIINYKYGDEND